MSTRERWIVYPLLFLALGIAMRDKVVNAIGTPWTQIQGAEIKAPRIHCGQLVAKEIVVNGPNGRPVILAEANPRDGTGIIKTLSANGFPLVVIHASDTGGIVSAIGQLGKVLVDMGHQGQNFGVFAEMFGKKELIRLTNPVTFENRQPTPSQPQGATPAGAQPDSRVRQPAVIRREKPGTDAEK